MDFFVVNCVFFVIFQLTKLSGSSPATSITDLSVQNSTKTANLSASSNPELGAAVSAECCNSKHRNRIITQTGLGLRDIPEGYTEVYTLNIIRNEIQELPAYVFWNKTYTGLRKLNLQYNKLEMINVNAFRGIRQLKTVDLSDNNIKSFDPYTFKYNSRLQKLILVNNNICFGRLQTFILSHSLEHLDLSNNKIDQIYELTFLGLPYLKSLILSNNDIYGIAPNSFRTLRESMFSRIPNTMNLEGTPLACRFEPPLKKVKGESVFRLLSLSRIMLDENYFTKTD